MAYRLLERVGETGVLTSGDYTPEVSTSNSALPGMRSFSDVAIGDNDVFSVYIEDQKDPDVWAVWYARLDAERGRIVQMGIEAVSGLALSDGTVLITATTSGRAVSNIINPAAEAALWEPGDDTVWNVAGYWEQAEGSVASEWFYLQPTGGWEAGLVVSGLMFELWVPVGATLPSTWGSLTISDETEVGTGTVALDDYEPFTEGSWQVVSDALTVSSGDFYKLFQEGELPTGLRIRNITVLGSVS